MGNVAEYYSAVLAAVGAWGLDEFAKGWGANPTFDIRRDVRQGHRH